MQTSFVNEERVSGVVKVRLHIVMMAWLWSLSMGPMAEVCQPSEWGVDDQIGAANRITAERTRAAAALVKQGVSHPLGIVIAPGMPAYPPRYTALQVVQTDLHFRK